MKVAALRQVLNNLDGDLDVCIDDQQADEIELITFDEDDEQFAGSPLRSYLSIKTKLRGHNRERR